MLPAVHLERDAERVEEIELLAASAGGRVGLEGVLGDLSRRGRRQPAPGRAVRWAVALGLRDSLTLRWWPQGITTSADRSDEETFEGRQVVLTSSYAKRLRGVGHGSRLTVFDVTDRSRVRYQHVLLVEVVATDGVPVLRPVPIHAGGIVWHGSFVHVAGTARGLFTFKPDDVVRLEEPLYGHRYVLPMRYRYRAVTGDGEQRLRYSFLSLDRTGAEHQLVAGEYGRGDQTTRVIRYAMDPATGLLSTDPAGASRPRSLDISGIEQMQGVVSVEGDLFVTQSLGRRRRGSLWVGRAGAFTEHPHALPQGPEDLCYWPSRNELWCVSEHPLLRYVFAVDRPPSERS
ncbi:MAG TPA: hypothetical protein VFK41_11440 [Nocardioidaceae bacterium]|nr:hypothetical protein [Nocardioidaceae bacterium]